MEKQELPREGGVRRPGAGLPAETGKGEMAVKQEQRKKEDPEIIGRDAEGRSFRKTAEDDGRTVADMSGIGGPSLFRMRSPGSVREPGSYSKHPPGHRYPPENAEDDRPDRPWEQADPWTPQERRMYALGALKAALLIGLTFIVGLGAVILVMILVWT